MVPSSPVVRRAVAADLKPGTAALASAFSTDPILQWLIGSKVQERMEMLFEGSLRGEFAKPSHIVDVASVDVASVDVASAAETDAVLATALWHDVDEWQSPTPPMRVLLPRLFQLFGRRSLRAMRISPAMASVHPEEPHRYLHFIGVHQEHQGKGLGGALLTSMLNECDELGLPAYLESSNPVNNAMYHRFGFEDRGLVPLPKGAPPMMAMWRNAR